MKQRWHRAVTALAALSALASSPLPAPAPAGPVAAPIESKAGTPTAVVPAGPAAPPRQAWAPNAAYFVIAHGGLVRLAAGVFDTWDELPASRSDDLTDEEDAALAAQIRRLPEAVAADAGSVWTLSPGGAGHPEGNEIHIDLVDPPGPFHLGVRAGPKGERWLLATDVVGHTEAGQWRFEDRTKVGLSYGVLRDLAIDPSGRAWLATSAGLWAHDALGWQPFKLDGSQQIRGVAARGDTVVSMTSEAVLRIRGGQVVSKVALNAWWREETIAGVGIDAARNALIATQSGHLVVYPESGPKRDYPPKELRATTIRSLATDQRGRIWLATDNGLAVITAGRVELRPLGAIPQLAGAIISMAITGDGPELPPAVVTPKVPVVGRLALHGAPVSGLQLLLCPHPSVLMPAAPCEGAPVKFEATTDAAGSYRFFPVPVGGYGRAWKEAGARTWNVLESDDLVVRGTGEVSFGVLEIQK